MKRILTTAVVALALAALVLPARVGATEAYQFHFRDRAASALFIDDDGCVITGVYVITGQVENQTPPGAPTAGAYALVDAFRYDYCNGIPLLDVSRGYSENVAVSVDQHLDAATLQGTVAAYDAVTASTIALDLDLAWGGAGSVARGNFHEHFQADGVTINERGNGSYRPAVASGSVTHAGANLTPAATEYASIRSTKSGGVVIDRNV